MSNILVVAEVRNGVLKRPSLGAVSAARTLAEKTGGKVVALAIGQGLDDAGAELASGGAADVLLADMAERSQGASLRANIALLLHNAATAANLAGNNPLPLRG